MATTNPSSFQSDPIFTALTNKTIVIEGGYVNNPHDRGGPTKYGIAWNYNVAYLQKHWPDIFKVPEDIQKLTPDQAKQVYYDKYWIPSNGNTISYLPLAYVHYDAAVNCGVGQAKLFLSRIKSKSNSVADYMAQRLKFYAHDCPKEQRVEFLEGWVMRCAAVMLSASSL